MIKLKDRNISFLLGAGFSFECKIPLTKDFNNLIDESNEELRFEPGKNMVRQKTRYDYFTNSFRKTSDCRYNDEDFIIFYNNLIKYYRKERKRLDIKDYNFESIIGSIQFDLLHYKNTLLISSFSRKSELDSIFKTVFNEEFNDACKLGLLNDCIKFLTKKVFDKIHSSTKLISEKYQLFIDLINSNSKTVNILTTNYDEIVEKLLELNKIPYSDGFSKESDSILESVEEFKNQNLLYFSESNFNIEKVNLFKLHGSINWGMIGIDTVNNFIENYCVKYDFNNSIEITELLNEKFKPKHIFSNYEYLIGSFNKSEGYYKHPYNRIQFHANNQLFKSDTLFCVGYGFSDRSLNLLLVSWLKYDRNNRIIVIDPNIINLENQQDLKHIFKSHLKDQMILIESKFADLELSDLDLSITV